MQEISREQLEDYLDFPDLIEALRVAFQANYVVPARHHHDYRNPGISKDSTLLLMPAWETAFFGVKLATVSPGNSQFNLPAINGVYILFDTQTGVPLAQLEAKALTTKRTAAASALASSYLSRPDCHTLLMIGTGALAPQLIRAHASVRPIRRVMIWGRRMEKIEALIQELTDSGFELEAVSNLPAAIAQADIISCATLSAEPLLFGEYLREGQHIDLVGSYKPNMREADDEVIRRSKIFVDTRDGASRECGDIAIPLANGLIRPEDILADLFELCQKQHSGRLKSTDITLFKSVGHALEDLAAAKLAFQRMQEAD